MAKLDGDKLQKTLDALLPAEWVETKARALQVVVRERKVKIAMFVWSLVLGFATASEDRTITALRRAYQRAAGVTIAPSSFYDRFTAELVHLMRACLDRLLADLCEPGDKLMGILKSFADLIITDSTVVRLCALLKDVYPGARTNHSPAAAKLHVVISAAAMSPRSIKLTSGRDADGPVFTVGKWVKDRLLTFDLGYFCYHLFVRISENGGYFVSRLKECANPVIVGENIAHRLKGLAGANLLDVIHRFKTDVVDLRVRVRFKRRAYRGSYRWDEHEFRLIGVFNHETRAYHFYLTNIPADRLTAQEVARAYSFRWEIELFFKEVKGWYHLEDLNTGNEAIVQCLLYAAMITAIVARGLRDAILRALPKAQRRIPRRRFAAVFSTIANRLLEFIAARLAGEAHPVKCLLDYLIHESVDPNVSRRLILSGVTT